MKRATNVIKDEDDEVWNYSSQKCTKQKQANTPKSKTKSIKHKNSPATQHLQRRTFSQMDAPTRGKDLDNVETNSKRFNMMTPIYGKNSVIAGTGLNAAQSAQNQDPSTSILTESTDSHPPSGYCPSCQMPFDALTTENIECHVTKCLDSYHGRLGRSECRDGASCACTIADHYQRYRHSSLASLRAGLEINPVLNSSQQKDVDSKLSRAGESSDNGVRGSRRHLDYSRDGISTSVPFARVPIGSFRSNTLILADNALPSLAASSQQKLLYATEEQEMKYENYPYVDDIWDDFFASSQLPVVRSPTNDDDVAKDGRADVNAELDEFDLYRDIVEMLGDDGFEDETNVKVTSARESCHGDALAKSPDKASLINSTFSTSGSSKNVTDSKSDRRMITLSQKKKSCTQKEIGRSSQATTGRVRTPNKRRTKTERKCEGNGRQLSMNMFFKSVRSGSQEEPRSERISDEKRMRTSDSFIQNEKSSSSSSAQDVLSDGRLTTGNVKDGRCIKDTVQDDNSFVCSSTKHLYNKDSLHRGLNTRTEIIRPENGVSLIKLGNVGRKKGVSGENDHVTPAYRSQRVIRNCPFYKRIPNTTFSVDAFNYGVIPSCTAYFLSHYHYDHFIGLNKNFSRHLYCSRVTANLVALKIKVQPQFVHALPLNQPQTIDGVEVTLLDANHCPGSVMFLFRLPGNDTVLHTGDFRAGQFMENYPELRSLLSPRQRVSRLFLDTTYCDPSYDFPSQKDVIEFAVAKTMDVVSRNPNTMVAVGTYTIGKERICTAIADALDCRMFAERDKTAILGCLEDGTLDERLTSKASDARLHVLRMNQLGLTELDSYLDAFRPRYDHLVAFEPTGWTHNRKTLTLSNLRPKASSRHVTVYAVPYSEHSSYSEMKRFVQFVRPGKIVPTVNNGNAAARKKMEELFRAWQSSPLKSPTKIQIQRPLDQWLDN